jgi:hypothetical protein
MTSSLKVELNGGKIFVSGKSCPGMMDERQKPVE